MESGRGWTTNITHRHECFLFQWDARIQSQYIWVESSTQLFGRLSRLVVVSDAARLYGPIPERRSRSGMHCTPCPGSYKVVISPSCTILESCASWASSDVVISKLGLTLDSVVHHLQDNFACVIGVQLKLRELIFSSVILNLANPSTTIGALPDCSTCLGR